MPLWLDGVRKSGRCANFHTDPECPALNDKLETYEGREKMPEDVAKGQDFKACKQCER